MKTGKTSVWQGMTQILKGSTMISRITFSGECFPEFLLRGNPELLFPEKLHFPE